ncbi:MAG: insulinase family protein [Pseudomonadota bacterium]
MIATRRAVTCLILFFGLAACNDDTNRVISEHTSPAGHVFQLMPITERGVTDITVSAAWATDWLNDPNNNPWVPNLATEMMISGGTAELSPADVLELLEDKNAYGDIGAAADLIYAEVEFPNNHRDTVVPVLADLFQRPVFASDWFDRIKGQRRDAAAVEDTAIAFDMWEASRYAIFGKSAQAEFTNGRNVEMLDAASLDELRVWHQESFSHAPVALVVTGAVNAEDAGEIVDALLPPPGSAPAETFDAVSLQLPEKMIYLHRPEAEKSLIGFIGTLPDTRDGKDGVDLVIANLFAGGADSPLFDAIRTNLGATYGMSVELVNYSRAQRGVVIAGEIDTEKMPEARDAVLAAYSSFRTEPDLDSLTDITQRIADSIRQEMVFVNSSARIIRELLLDERDPQDYQTLPDAIAQLDVEAVQTRLVSAFPDAVDLAIFAAGPDPSAFPDACIITTTEQALAC